MLTTGNDVEHLFDLFPAGANTLSDSLINKYNQTIDQEQQIGDLVNQ